MEQVTYMIGQALGVVAIVLGFVSYQMKTQKQLLVMQIITCVVFCVHYMLIGAVSGMSLNAVCALRNIVYYYRNKRNDTSLIWPSIFAVILGIIGILTWEAWYSVFVFSGLIINTLCLAFTDPQKVRKSILVTSPLVIIYDVFALSIGGIVYESVAIISSVIGIIRNNKNRS